MRTFPGDFRLLLASQSPRRRELLQGLGVPFTLVPSSADERLSGDVPEALAEANALAKARAAELPAGSEGGFVLGTDTIVVIDGRALGKPRDRREAAEMLEALAGREHEVLSGVAVVRLGDGEAPDRVTKGHACTVVRFMPLGSPQVEAYLDSGEWEGKAGGYAIQGLAGLFIGHIEGEYANVVGLPVHLLYRLFRDLGFDLLRGAWVAEG